MSSRHLEVYEKVTIRIDYNSGMVFIEDYDEGTLLWSFRKAEDVPKIIEREDPVKIVEQAREYFNTAVKVKESFMDVNVNLCEDGTLWIDDAKTDEQLAKFKVVEGE